MLRLCKLKHLLCFMAGLTLACAAFGADAYPSKPVTILVPYPAGGLSDVVARIVAKPLGDRLGQPVVVENSGGAAGAIGVQKVLASPADGYYVLQGSPSSLVLSPLINPAIKYKSDDLRMLQVVVESDFLLVARQDLPVTTADELAALARASGVKQPLSYGSIGTGSFHHLIGNRFSKVIGAHTVHVPYKGITPLMQDLIGQRVDFAMLPYSKSLAEFAAQRQVKILGSLSKERIPALQPIPSVNEGKALKDFNFSIWSAYFVRKDTPEPVVKKLHLALSEVLHAPSVRESLEAQGQKVPRLLSNAEAEKFYQESFVQFRALAKEIALKE